MPAISVIVPVYKVEKYIGRCINSIIDQTYQDWELLLVDDGSPDSSGMICDEYAQKDFRIKVFHKKNGGVSSARNVGLDSASGEWVMFVDSDDWIDSECLQICVSEMKLYDLDLLQFPFKRVDENGVSFFKSSLLESDVLSGKDYWNVGKYNVCAWGCVVRRSLIEKNAIRFINGVKLAEDQLFVMSVVDKSIRTKSINKLLYNYFYNANGAVCNSKSDDIFVSCDNLIEYKSKNIFFSKYINWMVLFFAFLIIQNGDKKNREVVFLIRKLADCDFLFENTKGSHLDKIYWRLLPISVYLSVSITSILTVVQKKVYAKIKNI